MLDFTAEWCLNCKTLEATVLSRRPVKPELLSGDVVPMAADLTSTALPGWDKLNELGSQGIPLLAVFTPGQPEPVWQEGAYSGSQVVAAIEEARRRRDASAGSARDRVKPAPARSLSPPGDRPGLTDAPIAARFLPATRV